MNEPDKPRSLEEISAAMAHEYIAWLTEQPGEFVALDGTFTSSNLREIADAMDRECNADE